MSFEEQYPADECAGCHEYEKERASLTARLAEAEARNDDLTILNQDLVIYRDQLRTDNECLRGLLREAVDEWNAFDKIESDFFLGSQWYTRVTAALEEKP